MTYHQLAVDIFPTKLELSVPHKSDDIIFPGSLAAGYAIYQNLDHFGFIEIAITYMNYCENSEGKLSVVGTRLILGLILKHITYSQPINSIIKMPVQ